MFSPSSKLKLKVSNEYCYYRKKERNSVICIPLYLSCDTTNNPIYRPPPKQKQRKRSISFGFLLTVYLIL